MSENNLKNHNEKRKAQDSSNNDLKDSRDLKELKDIQGTYEDFRDV
jgi:hypothetical protein